MLSYFTSNQSQVCIKFVVILYTSIHCRVQKFHLYIPTVFCWLLMMMMMIIIIIFIYCNWVVTRWQWLFYMCTKHEIGYY